jgi:hypothetical protein
MFFMTMPTTFRIGDTAECRINAKPQRVTWTDKDTLVIEPDDARKIIHTISYDGGIDFTCGDAATPPVCMRRHT